MNVQEKPMKKINRMNITHNSQTLSNLT